MLKEKFQTISIYIILLSGILDVYGKGDFSFAFVIIVLLSLLNLFVSGTQIKNLPRWLIIYFAFSYFSYFISRLSPSALIPIGIIKNILVCKLVFDIFELSQVIKAYRRIALVCILFFLFQTFSRYVLGVEVYGVLRQLPLALGNDDVDYSFFEDRVRDCSFFAEPAHFAQFLLPLLALEMFLFTKRSIIRIVLILITLLFLQSGNALLGIIVISVFLIIKYISFSLKNIIVLVLLSVALVSSGVYYLRSEIGSLVKERIDNPEEDFSAFLRIYRGYYVYSAFDLEYKIIGNNNRDYLRKANNRSEVSWSFDGSVGDFYYNGIQYILLYTGIIGMLIFIFYCYDMYRHTTYAGKCLLFLFICLSFVSSNYFSYPTIMTLGIINLLKNNKSVRLR